MPDSREQTEKSIFLRALELGRVGERDEYLDSACDSWFGDGADDGV